MSPELMTAIGVIILGVFTGFFGFMKYLIDKFLKELRPNGGTSLKDQINRIDVAQNILNQRVDEIYNILLTNQTKRTKRKNESN